MALKLRRKRKLGFAAALLAVMVLAACDTQPATDVTSNAATLNSKGKCDVAAGGTNQYQLRDYSGNGGWYDVGPRNRFDCPGAQGSEVALQAHRVGGLKSSNTYEFRLVSRMDNGSTQIWNSGDGTYDWFTTKPNISAVEEYPAEQFVSDPDDGSATAAANGCRTKVIKNIRNGVSDGIFLMFQLVLRTEWRYCNGTGQIVRMLPADAPCRVTPLGATAGYRCLDPEGVKVRANSYGGNPEHAQYTYRWRIEQRIKIKDREFVPYSVLWCATNAISGSGAHRRTGSCDLYNWNG